MRHPFKNVLEDVASYSDTYRSWGYKRIDQVKELFFKAPANKLVLGAYDEEFSTEPFCIPYHGQQINALFVGGKGSGKTSLMTLVTEQLYHRFKKPIFICDAKWEYFCHVMPNSLPEMRTRLEKYGLSPLGLPLFVATPEFCVEPEEKDVAGFVYKLELSDFKAIHKPSERYEALLSFFGLYGSGKETSQKTLIRWLDRLPDSFEEFIDLLARESRVIAGTDKKRSAAAGTSLLDELQSKKMGGAIGKGSSVSFPSVMMRPGGVLGDVVVMQSSVESAEDPVLASYLRIALSQIIRDRMRAKKLNKGFLTRGCAIVIDEVDLYCPNLGNPPAKKTIERLPLKYRVWDISSLVATQRPQFVSEKLVSDVDYIFTYRLQTEGEKKFLRAKGMGDDDIHLIFNDLKYGALPGHKEVAVVMPDGSHETFFPLPSMSEMFRESSFR